MNSLTFEGFNTSLGSIRNIIGDVILLGPSEVTTIDANFTLKGTPLHSRLIVLCNLMNYSYISLY